MEPKNWMVDDVERYAYICQNQKFAKFNNCSIYVDNS